MPFFGTSHRGELVPLRQGQTTRPPPNAACSGVNWICICGYNHVTFDENMRVVVFAFAELSRRCGLCVKKSRRGTAIDKKMTGGRRGRERGAGGRARCVWWPRCALLGCAALKSAHLSLRQRDISPGSEKRAASRFFSWFLNGNEFEIRSELT